MKKLILLILTVGACISCSDFLNLKPKNKVVVYTQEDVKESMSAYLFAIASEDMPVSFNGYSLTYPFDSDADVALVMYGDDVDMPAFFDYQIGEDYEKMYNQCIEWKGLDLAERMWKRLFVSIGYMNELLKNLDNAPDGDPDEYERIAGEAKVFRAYYIFKLTQLYSPYKQNDYGIPLNLDADNVTGCERWKQTDVYNVIIDELQEVLNYQALPTKWNVMYDKNIIYAMLAQIYCYKAGSAAAEETDWVNAEKYSEMLITKYPLENSEADFMAEFVPEPQIGIFKNNLHALLTLVRWGDKTGYRFAPWGAEDERQLPSKELVDLINEFPNDIRANSFIGYQKMRDEMKWYIGKWNFYIHRTYYNTCSVLFRIAEMNLINAEAKARMGNIEAAKELLVKFRQTRIPGYTSFSGDILQEILKERRKELCYESDSRFMDIKRLGLAVTRKGLDVNTNRVGDYSLEANDYRYTLPIPNDAELMYNKIPQNPGWNIVK